MSRITSVVAGAIVAAALSFASAGADPATITMSATAPTETGMYQVKAVKVAFADVDLSTAQGAAVLLDRIDAAARMICGERAGRTMDEARAKIFATCRTRAVHYAVKDVDAPQLTQLTAVR
jgi:UrcA family protein